MSRLARLLVATSLFAGACSPAVTTRPDAGPHRTPIVQPQPKIDRAKLRAALEIRRQDTYNRFLAYREHRVYPVNTYESGFEHVWLDSFGNLCAAATLISADWGRAASERVAAENNFVRIADIHDGPLLDWVLTSGMTHHEIVAIQAPGIMPDGSVGWDMPSPDPRPQPEPEQPVALRPDPRAIEVQRLYDLYVDVERQLSSMWDESLDDATDDLMAHPDLARAMIDGVAAGPGRFEATQDTAAIGFAQPPPA